MRFFRALFSRMGATVVLLLLQIFVFGVSAVWAVQTSVVAYYVGIGLTVLVFSYVLKKDDASVYKIVWIIIILAYPPIGGVIYLFFGNKRAVKRIASHINEHAIIARLLDEDGNLPFVSRVKCGRMYSLMQYVRNVSGYHAYNNTECKYYPMGELMFDDILDAIRKAEKFIFIEFFIVKDGQMWQTLLSLLEEKAAAGVEVRLIIDHMGSHKLFTKSYLRFLLAKKIHVLRFNPMVPFLLIFMNNRDHRKILVIDGKEAFTGGINIADEYVNLRRPYGIWKDTGIRLRGDAVWSFTLMFIEMWDTFCKKDDRISDYESYRAQTSAASDGFVIPYGDTPLDREALGENVYCDILSQAENYVYIFTPYLIISEKLISALQLAAKRGVDVRVVTPGIPDKKLIFRLTRSYYRYLLDAGVKIYEYAPGFLHAKSMVADDETAVVGTINLDYRSLFLHFECAVLIHQSSIVKDIRDDALRAIEESRLVPSDPPRWRLWSDLLDALLHLFAPLL